MKLYMCNAMNYSKIKEVEGISAGKGSYIINGCVFAKDPPHAIFESIQECEDWMLQYAIERLEELELERVELEFTRDKLLPMIDMWSIDASGIAYQVKLRYNASDDTYLDDRGYYNSCIGDYGGVFRTKAEAYQWVIDQQYMIIDMLEVEQTVLQSRDMNLIDFEIAMSKQCSDIVLAFGRLNVAKLQLAALEESNGDV